MTPSKSNNEDIFELADDEGWQDMPVLQTDPFALGLDEEDQKKYHYVIPNKSIDGPSGNATGNLIDIDPHHRNEEKWRTKLETAENEYTRLRLNDDDDADEVHLRTRYLFDEDKAMTPLSQMQTTKNLLTEAQRIAYVGLCYLACREMVTPLKRVGVKEMDGAIKAMELWSLKIMGRVYYHMELETAEQKMIESLAEHGVNAMDLVPSLMTTHTVANPEYDPAEAQRQAYEKPTSPPEEDSPQTPRPTPSLLPGDGDTLEAQANPDIPSLNPPTALPGVSTTLSSTDENVTLDIRWTVLCDLFLILIADSVYDSRSRVLLENVALKLGLGWLEVVRFEKRVTDALEIQEGVERLEQRDIIDGREKSAKKKRYVMMGLATLGGGLVIGLSAGLLAPVIGAGLGAAFATVGITGTTGFLAGAGGAAVITTGGILTGSGIAARGMARRTKQVHTFDLLPLHNNKRVNCIITVPGFMEGPQDDVRLPFSVLDPILGDVFSVLWEPEMMGEMGNALGILTNEVLSQVSTTVLQATVMTALMSALQWPLILTKLGYLIDNPWSNALDRAYAAGLVLADVLLHRNLGVRPITLIGFSLGARVIFYALFELSKHKGYGIVQDVFLLGATVTAPTKVWREVRGVVAGRFVNGFARNDWVLNYLFRATSGGLNTVAGLRPVENVPGLENVDVTNHISGHMSYRAFMPAILDQLGFPVSATYFNEPEEPDMEGDRDVIRAEEEESNKKKSRFNLFSRKKRKSSTLPSLPPSASSSSVKSLGRKSNEATTPSRPSEDDDDLPERMERKKTDKAELPPLPSSPTTTPQQQQQPDPSNPDTPSIPLRAGFDFQAIGKVLGKEDIVSEYPKPPPPPPAAEPTSALPIPKRPLERSGSAPPPSTYGPHNSPNSSSPPSISQLSTSFQRSMSLGGQDEPDPNLPSSSYDPKKSNAPYAFTPFAASSASAINAPWSTTELPTMSFGTPDGDIWSSNYNSKSTSSSPFYGNTNHKPSFESSSLTFGSVDGSISLSPSSSSSSENTIPFSSLSARDPWSASSSSVSGTNGKKSPFANPWDS